MYASMWEILCQKQVSRAMTSNYNYKYCGMLLLVPTPYKKDYPTTAAIETSTTSENSVRQIISRYKLLYVFILLSCLLPIQML